MNPIVNVITDITIVLMLGCIGLGLEIVASPSTPFQRGFYCNDNSIRYPYHGDTITTAMLIGIGTAVPTITIFLVEWFLYIKCANTNKPLYKRVQFGKFSIHSYAVALYSTIGPLVFGFVVTLLLTNCSKYLIGRLRPHFISVCQPDWSQINCTDEEGEAIYVLEPFCMGDNQKLLTDARLSFPSGHASSAFYLLLYWVVYLQRRFVFSPVPLLRPFLQVVGISMAVFCAETRISDYKHHPGDVVAGSFLGALIVILTALYVSDLYSRPITSLPSTEIHITNHKEEVPVKNYGSVEREMSVVSTVTGVSDLNP